MPYVTKSDLIARYTQTRLRELTDREAPYQGDIVDAVLDQAIASAASVIDGHLAARYTLPLAQVPALLTDIAARLAYAALFIDTCPDKVTADYQAAMRSLRDIAAGTVQLDAGAVASTEVSGGPVEVAASDRVFGRDNLRSW
ncbi:DUF1320 domain-containing protein (plasmid) [Azospirillum humicireducens]|uniref:DUF1320 domain-containing protein n=1 Tax=Azospirillum humicireducens TaxID=1226968 RepID=A0A2R4VQV5_9PROT|nr:DUF1320 domain-containing protein [Azospirillum humicireducens]AWB06810.1 DUF1320 domain-containing protein [Azospirillum humicireducens]